jgi:hypothetical protein
VFPAPAEGLNRSLPRRDRSWIQLDIAARERYGRALLYATIERKLDFRIGEQFAEWWMTSEWLVHRTVADGFTNCAAGVFPRAVDDDEE